MTVALSTDTMVDRVSQTTAEQQQRREKSRDESMRTGRSARSKRSRRRSEEKEVSRRSRRVMKDASLPCNLNSTTRSSDMDKSKSRRSLRSKGSTSSRATETDHTRRRYIDEEYEDEDEDESDMDDCSSHLGELPSNKDKASLRKAIRSTMRDDSVTLHHARRKGSARHSHGKTHAMIQQQQAAALGAYYEEHAVEDIEALELKRREQQRDAYVSQRIIKTNSDSQLAAGISSALTAHKAALLSLKLEHEDQLAESQNNLQSQPALAPELTSMIQKTKTPKPRSTSVSPELDLSPHKNALLALKEGVHLEPKKKNKNKTNITSSKKNKTVNTRSKSLTRPNNDEHDVEDDEPSQELVVPTKKPAAKVRRGRWLSRAPKEEEEEDNQEEAEEEPTPKKKTKSRKTRSNSVPPNLELSVHKKTAPSIESEEPIVEKTTTTTKKKKKKKKTAKSTSSATTRSHSHSKSRRPSHGSLSTKRSSTQIDDEDVQDDDEPPQSEVSWNNTHREQMMQQHSQNNKSWSTLGSLTANDFEPRKSSKSCATLETLPTYVDEANTITKQVRFSEQIIQHQLEPTKQDVSATWYSQEDLSMLLDHEMSIAIRALAEESDTNNHHSNQKRANYKLLHCCWRGLEHIQRRQDKAEHITRHVLSVLVIHHDLKKQIQEGRIFSKPPAELLRAQSKSLTREDRKLAFKYGMQDAKEARGGPNDQLDVIMELVRQEHAREKERTGNLIERSVRGVRRSFHQSMQELGHPHHLDDARIKYSKSSKSRSERGSRPTVVDAISMLRHPKENTELILGALKNS